MSKELKRPIESDYVDGSTGYFEYDAWDEAQKKYIDQLESKLQAVKDSLMSDEEIEQDAKDGGLIGGEAQLYWEGATFQRERTKKAIGCS